MALLALLIAIWLALAAWRRRQIAVPHWQPLAWTAAVGFAVSLLLLLVDLEAQKLAVHLLAPLGVVWLVLAACLLAAIRDREWARTAVLGGCWLVLTLGGNAWLGAWLLGRLEAQVPQPEPAVRWDAACVLGGGTDIGPDGVPELGAAGDRLRVGAEMWLQRRVPILVGSGSGLLGSDADRDLGEEAANLWHGWGIPDSAIVRLPGPVNTRQEIAALAELAHERGWRRVALVTSAWHLPRSLALARRFGLPADGVASDRRGRVPPASPIYLVPSAAGVDDVQRYLNEVVGRLVGR